ncbi:WD40 repeat domain-containing protein [Streptomyces sp. NPDC001571]|uniref:WD40 repeat domain-containing protein n=1 Tax=Streptomyces sp. NPDC056132 TaxID=3345722 RepID=UPI0035DB62CD
MGLERSRPGRVKRLPGPGSRLYTLAFAADGRRPAAGAADGKVLLWDLHGDQLPTVLTGHSGPVPTVAFSPDGLVLVTGGNDS